MSTPNKSHISDEAIAGALTELGEDVSVERVRRVKSRLEGMGRLDSADGDAFRAAVDVARNAPDGYPTQDRQSHDDAILEKYIKMSAESVASLRKDDVFRVLDGIAKENVDGVTRAELASFITNMRPDLEDEVREIMTEEFPADNWSATIAMPAPRARRAPDLAASAQLANSGATSKQAVLARLPGGWDDVGGGFYVKRYQNTDDFLEANVLSDGVLRLQAKAVGGVGDVMNAVQCVLERRVDPRDAMAIPSVVEELEGALARSANKERMDVPANDIADAQAAGFRAEFGAADYPDETLRGRWWWTLTQPGWSGVEVSEVNFAAESDAWADAIRALRQDPSLTSTAGPGERGMAQIGEKLLLDINGRSFAPVGMDVAGQDGSYEKQRNGVLLRDMAGNPFVFVVGNRHDEYFFVSCRQTTEGIRYQHSTTSLDAQRLGLDALGYMATRALAETVVKAARSMPSNEALVRVGAQKARPSRDGHTGPTIATRFSDQTGVFFRYFEAMGAKSFWQHVDMNDGRGAQVGPHYRSKDELLSDHESYLRRAGWLTEELGSSEAKSVPVVARLRADGNFNEAAGNFRRLIEQQSPDLQAELMGAYSAVLEAAEAVRDQYQSDWRAARAQAEQVGMLPAEAPSLSDNSYLNESIRRLQNGLDCYTTDAPEHAEISAALSALQQLQSGQTHIASAIPKAEESATRLPDSYTGGERVVRNLASFALMLARDAKGDEPWILAAQSVIGTLHANRPDLVPVGERFPWQRDESPSLDM
ncbi:hypothetical protein [Burkholderia ambifaria]|uniref:hypothetical protein n=1 Tax=Burkholderia ambifaria TaxID=152480 RepID=UPI002FE1DC60